MRFSNKICMVTGGTSGIGQATCLQMGREGGTVVVMGRDENAGNETVNTITSAGGQGMFLKIDIGNGDEVKQAVDTVVQTYGRIDIMVNDAAMMTFKPIIDLDPADWDSLMNVNLRSLFLFCKYALPHINNGAIVNISSVHAHETTPNVLPYAASKGAIEAFTRGLSIEYPPAKSRFNCVAPGAVNTPMLWNNPNVKSGAEKVEGAIGKPENLAAAICFLASDDAAFVNGTTLVVDGGRLDIL